MIGRFSNGQEVSTPNGRGFVQDIWGERVLVRHWAGDLTGVKAGECITPRAVRSMLYVYPVEEVQPARRSK